MMEIPLPSRRDIRRVQAVGAVIISYFAIGIFQAGREVEQADEPDTRLTSPVSWVAAPIADAVQNLGIVDSPED